MLIRKLSSRGYILSAISRHQSAVLNLPPISTPYAARSFANINSTSSAMDDGPLTAERVANVLRTKFPEADGSSVQVEDISGGCGAMFHVKVESPQFDGVTRVNQHKMINEVLRGEIKSMHGITIDTKPLNKK